MNSKLASIKSAIVNGGYIDNSDYFTLMQTAKCNTEDGKDAQSILRTYNDKSDRGVYNSLNDPMRGVTCREEGNERSYGRLGRDLF